MQKYFISIVLLLLMVSCQSPEPIEPNSQTQEPATLSLKIAGSELSGELSTEDIIAIQIYSYDDSGVKSAYAYGLYDNFSIGDIVLVKGAEYSIEASYVCDAKNRLYSTAAGKYYAPFGLYPNSTTAITNAFVTSTYYLYGLMSGECKLKSGSSSVEYSRGLLERYAGDTGVFTAGENTEISLSLNRVYTTLRLNAEGVSSGTITLVIEDSEPIEYSVGQGSCDYVLSLGGTTPSSIDWAQDGYSEEVSYELYYDSGDGAAQMVSSGVIGLVRSTVLPVNVVFNSSDIDFDIEDSEMDILSPFDIVI
ncbi:MAG: hypothetical protein R3Y49_06035 [Rikenellaceae bacterium]